MSGSRHVQTPSNDVRTRAIARGTAGELQARAFLEASGMQLIEAGWRCRLGELDLIMRDRDVLVFVEVRARGQGGTVSARESVDWRKQKKFIRAARAWMAANPEANLLPARFDVVAIDGTGLEWITDAFSTDGR
jgi:putative endonuclease